MSFVGKTASVFGVVGLSAIATLGSPEYADASVLCGSASLPPTCGGYITSQNIHAFYDLIEPRLAPFNIQLNRSVHTDFSSISREYVDLNGNGIFDEKETFHSRLLASVTLFNQDGSELLIPDITLTGSVMTVVFDKDSDTGLFDTEMRSLDLNGFVNIPDMGFKEIHIRENPEESSNGQILIENINSDFKMTSYFDIFTQLSLDGENWVDSTDPNSGEIVPVRVDLKPIPEPSTVFGLGLTVGLGALGKNRHSRKRNKKDVS
jgi:hypothetical protein